jgi:hypothetical protein
MLAFGRQLEALWVLSEPRSGMNDLLGHAIGQTLFILAYFLPINFKIIY